VTPLERALRHRILSEGPLTVEAFMDACNSYYYATRDPLGGDGDFTTAPEISQMFGELVGACLADCWVRADSPDAIYAEFGPGRGTLAADALRVMRSAGLEPEVHFVETSPVLREAQSKAVPNAAWHDDAATLPGRPLLAVANEFLDALPVRQFVNGVERRVIPAAGGLAFDRDGEIVEESPARQQAVTDIAAHLVQHGGVLLIIDYGHARSGPGDTLQAIHAHGFAPVLSKPGEQDLTAHVDFETVSKAANDAGAAVSPLAGQGEWLQRLGIGERANSLATAHPDRADDIEAARARLCNPEAMGALFKVLAIHSPQWPAPAGFQ
jgi:SAM-dependent MidA family methyltransferase